MGNLEKRSDFININNKIESPNKDEIAYAFNMKSWTLLFSNKGHRKITKNKDKRDFCGGWFWKNSGRIVFSCGILSRVPDKFKKSIKDCIEKEFNIKV